MRNILRLGLLTWIESARGYWPILLSALMVIVIGVVTSIKISSGDLAGSPGIGISSLAITVGALGLWSGLIAIWTLAGNWYDAGLRSGALVWMILKPVSRPVVLVGVWAGILGAATLHLWIGALTVSGVALWAGTSPIEVWQMVLVILPCIAMLTAIFLVGPMYASRGVTAVLILLLLVGESLLPMLERQFSGGGANTLTYVIPPILPPQIDSALGGAGSPDMIPILVYQLCATILILLLGIRRLETAEISS